MCILALEKHKHMETKQHATKTTMGQQWIKEEIRKYLKTNENENIAFQNPWDVANAVLKGKFIVINAYVKKKERAQHTKQRLKQKLVSIWGEVKAEEHGRDRKSVV